MMSTSRVSWIKPALFLLIAVGLCWIARAAGVDIRKMTPERIRGFVLSFGICAPLIYLLVYSRPLVPLPAGVMTITGGLAFGSAWDVIQKSFSRG